MTETMESPYTKRMPRKKKTTAKYDYPTLCKKIREEEGNKTQSQMADLIGVSEDTWANWENGRTIPSADALMELIQIRANRRLINLKGLFDSILDS